MVRFVVGVMGAGEQATPHNLALAEELGRLLALEGWVVLSGGRDCGVMRAVNKGAKQIPNSLTIGILPTVQSSPSPDLDIAVITDLHSARNNINVLSSHVVVACGVGGAGTVSEIALALKAGKPVILLDTGAEWNYFFQALDPEQVQIATEPKEVIQQIRQLQALGT
ncbi:TIGR00725 family protein [Synechocystis sp. LKSZ1]|uniref:SLOG cluster 4 domain-containing protein n=1 Tax=Synechocystis sp. LKSZ1 TaxID=3144951 RepID=UPI00336BFFEF